MPGGLFATFATTALSGLTAERFFHVAYGVVCFAFRSVELALSRQLLSPVILTAVSLIGAFCLVGGAPLAREP